MGYTLLPVPIAYEVGWVPVPSGRGRRENLLQPGTEPRFLGSRARNCAVMLTEIMEIVTQETSVEELLVKSESERMWDSGGDVI